MCYVLIYVQPCIAQEALLLSLDPFTLQKYTSLSSSLHQETSSFFYTSPYTSLCFKVTQMENYQLHRIKYTYVFPNEGNHCKTFLSIYISLHRYVRAKNIVQLSCTDNVRYTNTDTRLMFSRRWTNYYHKKINLHSLFEFCIGLSLYFRKTSPLSHCNLQDTSFHSEFQIEM